jgi:dynein intermediate chain 1
VRTPQQCLPLTLAQVVHYASDGWLLHELSDEARKQAEQDKGEAEASARFQAEMDRALKEKVGVCVVAVGCCWRADAQRGTGRTMTHACPPAVLQAAGLDVELPDDSRQLRNQFNFSERAAQTFSYPLRDRATFTEPAPTATASGVYALQAAQDCAPL